jgi:hypothetical protein
VESCRAGASPSQLRPARVRQTSPGKFISPSAGVLAALLIFFFGQPCRPSQGLTAPAGGANEVVGIDCVRTSDGAPTLLGQGLSETCLGFTGAAPIAPGARGAEAPGATRDSRRQRNDALPISAPGIWLRAGSINLQNLNNGLNSAREIQQYHAKAFISFPKSALLQHLD